MTFNKICKILYELAILMTLVLAILTPLHSIFTEHFVIEKINENNTVILSGDTSILYTGDQLPIYRFNPTWKQSIGSVEIKEILNNNEVLASYNPLEFKWPIADRDDYAYVTQGTYFNNHLISYIEIILMILIPVIYLYFLIFKNKSILYLIGNKFSKFKRSIHFLFKPILLFWKIISYQKHPNNNVNNLKHGLLMWGLNLIIIYVFGYTLIGFLSENIKTILSIGIPNSIDVLFQSIKYIVWSLTVLGCIFGYLYSLFSVLWGKYIRHIDFTIVGWITNLICYPILGVYIWNNVPSYTGLDPIITSGPLFYLMLFMGFILNILYMITIWNLGKMFGVMSDKGVRKNGFYSVVRHPSYTLEVLMFFTFAIIGFSTILQWISISIYFIIYWIRSEREDNFMQYSNPEYVEYQKNVKFKFIPGIY